MNHVVLMEAMQRVFRDIAPLPILSSGTVVKAIQHDSQGTKPMDMQLCGVVLNVHCQMFTTMVAACAAQREIIGDSARVLSLPSTSPNPSGTTKYSTASEERLGINDNPRLLWSYFSTAVDKLEELITQDALAGVDTRGFGLRKTMGHCPQWKKDGRQVLVEGAARSDPPVRGRAEGPGRSARVFNAEMGIVLQGRHRGRVVCQI